MPGIRARILPGLVLALALGVACTTVPANPAGSSEPSTGTWSIVGVEVDTQEVGVDLASCVPASLSISLVSSLFPGQQAEVPTYRVFGRAGGSAPFELARLVPGQGAMVAQGLVDSGNTARLDRATGQLLAGLPPESIVVAATVNDPRSDDRQYGVVTLLPAAASFTGLAAMDWAGAARDKVVSVQGNLLVGPEVVAEALAAFSAVANEPRATLGDALMAALAAGAAEGGDRRCPKVQSALAAFIAVARRADNEDLPHLWLAAPPQIRGGEDPVNLLRESYDAAAPSPDGISTGNDGARPNSWWALAIVGPLLVGLALWTARRRRRRGIEGARGR